MIPEHIIKLAIEGGWKSPRVAHIAFLPDCEPYIENDRDALFNFEDPVLAQEIICDPLFWRALGKAKGWVGKTECRECFIAGFAAEDNCTYCEPEWKTKACQFFDILMTNGDTSKFWDSITSLNKTI